MFNEIIKYVESSVIVQIKKNHRQFVLKKNPEKKDKIEFLVAKFFYFYLISLKSKLYF